jgi:hypothetical protein
MERTESRANQSIKFSPCQRRAQADSFSDQSIIPKYMSARTLKFLALAFAALALAVIGCGKDEGAATGSAINKPAPGKIEEGPPSKAEFTKQAEAVCRKARDRQRREAVAYSREHRKELAKLKPIPAEEKIILATVLPAIQREAEELRALDIPKGDEKKIEAITTGIERGVKRARKDPYDSISFEDPSKYAFRRVGLQIRAYGLNDCRNVG